MTQIPKNEWWNEFITATKTRQEICNMYDDMSYKIFVHQLKIHKIELPTGPLTSKYQILIYEAFGLPASFFNKG